MRRALALLLLVGCTYARPADVSPLDGTHIEIASGNHQIGTVGLVLPAPVVVEATDAGGNPVADLTLELEVTAGHGRVQMTAVRTDVQGRVETAFELGPVPGENTLEVRTADLGLEPLEVTATGHVGKEVSIEIVDGCDHQEAIAGSPLPKPLQVRVVDMLGNPVPDVAVDLDVTEGTGSVSPPSTLTGADGIAQTVLTTSTRAGTNKVAARVDGLDTVELSAIGKVGPPVKLEAVAGTPQSAQAGAQLPGPLVAAVEDANGNHVSGVLVTFAVTQGNGTVSPKVATSDAEGLVETKLTLDAAAGPNAVEARSTDLTSAVFTASGTIGSATTVAFVDGNGQNGTVDTTLPKQLSVRVTDATGNPIQGFLVPFVVTAGNGQPLAATATTDAAGIARTGFRLGKLAGTNTIEARASGLTGSPVTFGETGIHDVPVKVLATQGNGPSIRAATPTQLVATVVDQFGNGVPSVGVSWFVTHGDGTLTAAGGTSNAAGQVTTSVSANTMVDLALEARATGLTKAAFALHVRGFRPRVDLATPNLTKVVTMDANRDSRPDLLIVENPRALSLRLNTTPPGSSTASFGAPIAVEAGVGDVAVADLDGDGDDDLVISHVESQVCLQLCVAVVINQTAPGSTLPTFAASVDTGAEGNIVTTLDVNQDGLVDIAAGLGNNSRFVVQLNQGGASFAAPVQFTASAALLSFEAVDMNFDGVPDIVGGLGSASSAVVMLNVTPMNATAPAFTSSSALSRVDVVSDFDRDGRGDAEAQTNSGSFGVRRNTSSSSSHLTFANPVLFTGFSGRGIARDFTDDGRPELVFEGGAIYINRSTTPMIDFGPLTTFGGASKLLWAADFNLDGIPDLVAAAGVFNNTGVVGVLLAE